MSPMTRALPLLWMLSCVTACIVEPPDPRPPDAGVEHSTWTPTARMASVRAGHTATLLPSGQVLVAGGRDETRYFATSELYTP